MPNNIYNNGIATSQLDPEEVRLALVEATRMPEALARASRLVDARLPVFPCRGKRPATTRGHLAATTERSDIARWWSLLRDAWVGMPTGLPMADGAWLTAIDIDPRHGGTRDPRLPRTLAVQTHSGGNHLFFRAPVLLRSNAGVIAPGVDVRGGGGYVIAAGNPGYMVVDESPIAPMPAWLVPVAAGQGGGTRRGGRQRSGLSLNEPIRAGGRNDGLARVAGALLARDPERDLVADLLDYNAAWCRPPLDADEVRRVAASIERTAERQASA